MRINSTNVNFTSKNPIIRQADDIARKVNQTFPMISYTKVRTFKNIDKFSFLKFMLNQRTNRIRGQKSFYFDEASRYIDKAIAFFEPIKRYKLGNCSESAQISAIVAKMNGIKDVQLMFLRDSADKSLDHVVCYVENEGKPYIIDSWLGVADYVPNMLEKYNGIYRNKFKFGNLVQKDMKFVPNTADVYSRFIKKDIPNDDLQLLKRLYPQLLVKKS